ncbi:MAG: hypothetical protein N2441_03755 [Rhodocyclaceae bacterium]|nr:hypothetical protein [Rhodocyclaceae bacterium]
MKFRHGLIGLVFVLGLTISGPPASSSPRALAESQQDRLLALIDNHLLKQDALFTEMLRRLDRIEGLLADLSRLIDRLPAAVESPLTRPQERTPTSQADDEDEAILSPLPWIVALTASVLAVGLAWRLMLLSRHAPHSPPVAPVSLPKAAPRASPARPSISPGGVQESSAESADQALELAEIMLSLGLGHGAAQTLIEQIHREPKRALRHWLKLLEIYRREGMHEAFDQAAEELRRHFNVRPEDWQPSHRPKGPSIEDFPHIIERLVSSWGKPTCREYIENLLLDNRGGKRSGFPQSVAEELLLLSAILRERATGASP